MGLPIRATTAVASNTNANITASTAGGPTVSRSLSILAPKITNLNLNRTQVTPQAVSDSVTVTGSLSLSGVAPAGGLAIPLTSSAVAAASVPSSVTVPAGQTSATFRVTAVPVATSVTATIQATHAGVNRSQSLTVQKLAQQLANADQYSGRQPGTVGTRGSRSRPRTRSRNYRKLAKVALGSHRSRSVKMRADPASSSTRLQSTASHQRVQPP